MTIRVGDLEACRHFYDTVRATLVIPAGEVGEHFTEWDDSRSRRRTGTGLRRVGFTGFVAGSREHVDDFWRLGTGGGYASAREPGERPQNTPDYYGSFLRDPEGNCVEAVHHSGVRPGGWIDHLWIGVEDLEEAAAFYVEMAAHIGIREGSRWNEGRQFRGAWDPDGTNVESVHHGRP